MQLQLNPVDYTITFNEPSEVTLTFINRLTQKTEKATVHIENPNERAEFFSIIEFPLEEFKFGLFKNTITPQDIINMTMRQIHSKRISKPNLSTVNTIYFESPSTQTFFQRDCEGNYIAYHWEGGGSFRSVK